MASVYNRIKFPIFLPTNKIDGKCTLLCQCITVILVFQHQINTWITRSPLKQRRCINRGHQTHSHGNDNAVADPGFSRGGANLRRGCTNLILLAIFSRKLHEIERKWTEWGHASLASPLGSANAISQYCHLSSLFVVVCLKPVPGVRLLTRSYGLWREMA